MKTDIKLGAKTGTSIVWFRNDLRIHDNEALSKAIDSSQYIIPLYCIDPSLFSIQESGCRKIGKFRARFLMDSLLDLRKQINKLGGKLLITFDKPENVIPQLASLYQIKNVYCEKQITSEELVTEQNVESALWKLGVSLETISGSTLIHTSDIPFTIKDLPDIFTTFRKKVESDSLVRPLIATPTQIDVPTDLVEENLPDLQRFDLVTDDTIFKGGETEALSRLAYYFWTNDLLKSYKETRNELLGTDYSSKFSPWLALGCISPRYIFHQIKKYEQERIENESTYWLYFELLWRDYFKFVFKKYGNKFFKEDGIKQFEVARKYKNQNFIRWQAGETGVPFIDANMKELKATGYMSNRGRQNVASYLVHNLNVNWLLGAAYFEEMLIDYDVCSNYGNWAYLSGVGNDPRENRVFNISKQARDYDPQATFMKHWLPALQNEPKEIFFGVS